MNASTNQLHTADVKLTAFDHCPTMLPMAGWAGFALFLLTPILASGGCRQARSDLYQQRMAGEIRVLEDQLYDADYQNRVLRDELHKYDEKVKASRIPTPDEVGIGQINHGRGRSERNPPRLRDVLNQEPLDIQPGVPVPIPDSHADSFHSSETRSIDDSLDAGLETESIADEINPNQIDAKDLSPDYLDGSLFDMGEPSMPNEISPEKTPTPSPDSPLPKPLVPKPLVPKPLVPKPLTDPAAEQLPKPRLPAENPPARKPNFDLLPPPIGISPPGENDTKIDPIIPGNITPPSGDAGEEKPPGQILLPRSTQSPSGLPERLRIHPTLSTGHRDGRQLDGATVVLNALDRLGRNVDLNQFDIQAELSVVVLDPDRDADEARIGRWNYTADQVTAMIAERQDGGIEIPVRWKDKKPETDKVVVHVRLRGDEEEMLCQANLDLRPRTAESTWTPRSE